MDTRVDALLNTVDCIISMWASMNAMNWADSSMQKMPRNAAQNTNSPCFRGSQSMAAFPDTRALITVAGMNMADPPMAIVAVISIGAKTPLTYLDETLLQAMNMLLIVMIIRPVMLSSMLVALRITSTSSADTVISMKNSCRPVDFSPSTTLPIILAKIGTMA